MVYCGRPSRGCDMCRVRKIRCDGARPTCSQCWVATRACPGYRDQPSLMVRNETAKVIQKVRGSGPISHKSIHEQKQWPSPALSQNTSKNPSPFVAIADDRIFHATCFFFRNYASLVVSRLGECHFRLGFFSDTCSGERALKASITSLGLANLGNIYTSPDLLRYARKYYGLAVNEINAAIDDPIQAAQDTTLAAILCVSLYEVSLQFLCLLVSLTKLMQSRSSSLNFLDPLMLGCHMYEELPLYLNFEGKTSFNGKWACICSMQ